MIFANVIVTMVRLVLGFSVLAFPFLLPVVISFFLADDGDDDEGTSNEDMWARERETSSRLMSYWLCDRLIHRHYSYTLLLEYTFSESLPSALAASTWLFEVIEQCIENSN